MTNISERLGAVESPPAHRRLVARQKPSAARERILGTADSLFYSYGLHAIGIDRIIKDAGVTRVTFYRHFVSKDDLIEAYLRVRGDRLRERIAQARNARPYDPRRTLEVLARSLVEDSGTLGYRGCEFVNAAAEFADEEHPAQSLGIDQRAWLVNIATEALEDLGHPQPRRLARKLMMLRTGATVVLGLDPYDDTGELYLEAWDAILEAELTPATSTNTP